jgi:hypothetical protein
MLRGCFDRFALDFLQLSEVFPGPDSNSKVGQLMDWLVTKGIRDFEAVPLNCENIGKVSSWIILIRFGCLITEGRKPPGKLSNWWTSYQKSVRK